MAINFITGSNNGETLYGTPGVDWIDGLLGNDELYGGSGGDDTIVAGPANPVSGYSDDDVVYGDTFAGGATNDVIYGGYGNDTLYGDSYFGGGGGNDFINGGYGNDLLIGGDGNDSLDGADDNDMLYGGSGNDALDGGSGTDQLFGGSGNDTYYIADAVDTITENASEGTDTVWSRVTYTLGANVENLVLYGSSAINGTGNSLNNNLQGNAADNKLSGGSGYDTVYYSGSYTAYNATFNRDGAVRMTGSEGTDQLYGIERINFGDGGFYNVHVGDGNNNSLTADPGVWSFLHGGGGNDTLTGSNYNDNLAGGNGDDIVFAGSGYDTATYFGNYTDYTASFASDGAVRMTGAEGTDLLYGVERISFGGGGFYNVYTGDAYDNTLTADPNVWSLLYGGGGNDSLTGGNGNDVLTGGSGNDILTGGKGKDTLSGGSGADRFKFSALAEGIDVIKDFSHSQGDKIEISKSGFGVTSLSQFSYNSSTGALYFGSTQFATLANKPTDFSIQGDLALVVNI